MCLYVYVFIHVCMSDYVCTCVFMYVCISIYVFVYICLCIHIFVYACVFIYVCTYVYIHVCVCIHIWLCIFASVCVCWKMVMIRVLCWGTGDELKVERDITRVIYIWRKSEVQCGQIWGNVSQYRVLYFVCKVSPTVLNLNTWPIDCGTIWEGSGTFRT